MVKKNGIMPLAAIWMDLEIIILSEFRERQISYNNHLHVESKKIIQLNLFTKQTDSQAYIINFQLSKGKGGGGRGKLG